MGDDQIVKRDEPGPDEMRKLVSLGTPEEDTEGHKRDAEPDGVIRRSSATPDDDGPSEGWRLPRESDDDTEGHKRDAEPDGAAKRGKDGDPGPDESKFSDRNLKTGIVPVQW